MSDEGQTWDEEDVRGKWERAWDVTAEDPRDLSGVGLQGDPNADITWPHLTKTGADHKHVGNVEHLLKHKGWRLRYNEFAARVEVDKGDARFVPLDDITVLQLHAFAGTKGLRPEKSMFVDLLKVLASQTPCHPVREYLAGLKWDGVARLDKWTSTYLGAENNPLSAALGRVMMLGAAHRVLHPGCQYDYMVVLEGPQGALKSSSLRVLGGEWFTDSLKLGSDSKVTIEQTGGAWIVEVAELAGMEKRDVEAVKAQTTMREDKARLAYGHFPSTVPRQWIAVGTTNSSRYLRDQTGNRRFLPIPIGKIDLAALKRDRDRLWAEAYHRAKAGELPMLPDAVLAAAAEAQAARVVVDAVSEQLRELVDGIASGRIEKADIYRALNLADPRSRNPFAGSISLTMEKLGWSEVRIRRPVPGCPGNRPWCFEKMVAGEPPRWVTWDGAKLISEDQYAAKTAATLAEITKGAKNP